MTKSVTAPFVSRHALVLFLLLIPAFAIPVNAAPTPATLIVGGHPVPFIVSPYVGSDGQVYAPTDAVRLLGASYAANAQMRTVTVTGGNGKTITTPYMLVQGRYCIALQKVAEAVGASADWQPTTRVLSLRARLQSVRQDANSLRVFTSYPVRYTVQALDDPHRLYVDLYGLDLAAAPASVPVSGGNATRIRSGQINFNTVRIVIDLKSRASFQVASSVETSQIQVALGKPDRTYSAPPPNSPPEVVASRPPPTLPNVPAGSVQITNVSCKRISDTLTQVAIRTTGEAKYSTEALNNPDRLAFDLAGATLGRGVRQILAADNSVIKAVRVGILHAGQTEFGRVVLDLYGTPEYVVTHEPVDSGTVYLINIPTTAAAPAGPSDHGPAGSLAGKIVVVDPGHGGADTGAVGFGAREKDFTLSIGRRLRDSLVRNGATVFMTRNDDTLPSVMARPEFAIAHHADYFVSVHCDDSGPNNSHSGTTVYFHGRNMVTRRFAYDVSLRVAQQSGIPTDGVKPDTIRFQTGFGVLRGSPMPAILVECGYINNERDLARLRDEGTQQHIAEGIVAGLRDFIADRAAR